MPHGLQCLWPWAHGDWTPLLIKTVELSFGRNRCPLGHSPYGHAFSHIAHGHGPIGGSPIYGHGPMGSPIYGHGPMEGSPVYGHGPIEVTYLWPWAYRDWTPLLIKAVELSFGRNRCPLGHSAYGNGGHLHQQKGEYNSSDCGDTMSKQLF